MAFMPTHNRCTVTNLDLKLQSLTRSCQFTQMTKLVLMIDDEAPLRRIAQLTLRIIAGWKVLAVGSGQEGLKQAEAKQPDVILLDLMMPDIDGIATLYRLQENPKTQHIPVIILTAKVQALYQFQYEQINVAAVLIKPFEPMTLVQQIKDILDWE
jgi:CheY-like chemotaxis protein